MDVSALSLRAAVPADVPRLVALVESAYRGESSRVGWTTEADLLDGQRTDEEEVSRVLATPGSRVLVAERDDGLVACCVLERGHGRSASQPPTAYFGMFAVRPALQGAGVGRWMLAAAERVAAEEWGARRMEMKVISARHDLIAWYERRGYVRTGRRSPFPYGDERFGIPRRPDLEFEILGKTLVTRVGRSPA